MSTNSSIEWTDATWNPTRGCTRVSAGCDHCYAMREARRHDHAGGSYEGLTRIGPRGVDWAGKVRLIEERLEDPLKWRTPRRIFVNSMSDLFHPAVPFEWVDRIFAVMALAPRHTFQVLTKRPHRMREYMTRDGRAADVAVTVFKRDMRRLDDAERRAKRALAVWPLPNVWLGTSVEDQQRADERIPDLLATPAAIRFISAEPLLGPIDFSKWIGYYPLNEGDESRGNGLRGSDAGLVRHPQGRVDLACGPAPEESMGFDRDCGAGGAAPNRCGSRTRIPDREGHGGSSTGLLSGASSGVAPQPRADSGWDADQSQGREQGKQPPEQSRTGDGVGQREACLRDRPEESGRPEESRLKGERYRGGRDSSRIRDRRSDSGSTGESLSGFTPVSVQDRARRSSTVQSRPNSGLQGSPDSRGASPHLQHGSIHQIIVGGESGPGARPCAIEWLESIVRQCRDADVPVFVKQLGAFVVSESRTCGQDVVDTLKPAVTKRMVKAPNGEYWAWRAGLKDRKGGNMDDFPESLKIREFPRVAVTT